MAKSEKEKGKKRAVKEAAYERKGRNMDIKHEYAPQTLVAKISGEIDHHTANALKEDLDREIALRNIKNLILDFDKVSFMDSSGIGVVVGRHKKISALGGRLLIIRTSPQIDKIFELSGLKKILNYGEERSDTND